MTLKTVKIKHLEFHADSDFIEVGKSYDVTSEVKDKNGNLCGYNISTPRNKWVVTLDQIEHQ